LTAPDDGFLAAVESPRSSARPWRIRAPAEQTAPLVFASPHSGRVYPPEFVAASRLDMLKLRLSEDAFMDEVFAAAPDFGAPLLCARFPRAYVDVNREAYELDPSMFNDPLPDYVNTSSPRIAAGLGTIARVVTDGEDIYARPLKFEDARRRIDSMYRPYHAVLKQLLEATRRRFGACLLVDCHSMPSGIGGHGRRRIDVVLGDCYGTTCAPIVTDTVQRELQAMDFVVTRNSPYAGGFTTRHYGRPKDGIHALQIEINRGLYMDEARVKRGAGMPALCRRIGRLMRALATIDPALLGTH
jgi:N-formylglutamate amidohydrolase